MFQLAEDISQICAKLSYASSKILGYLGHPERHVLCWLADTAKRPRSMEPTDLCAIAMGWTLHVVKVALEQNAVHCRPERDLFRDVVQMAK